MPVPPLILNIINNSSIGSCNLEACGLEDEDIADIIAVLQKQSSLKTLNVKKNDITFESAIAIATLPLEELYISRTQLADEGLIEIIKVNQTINWLDASYCNLSNVSANALLKNDRLIYINLHGNPKITDEMFTKVKVHVKENIKRVKHEQQQLEQTKKSIGEQRDASLALQGSNNNDYLLKNKRSSLTTAGTFRLPNDDSKEKSTGTIKPPTLGKP